jgi:phosphoglycerol transferase MdoB-like AlkP superfamily enzyme
MSLSHFAVPLGVWIVGAICVAAVVAELLVQPRSGARPKVFGSVILALFLAICVFLLTGRPVTSAVTSIALLLTLTIVSNVKYSVLKEPLLAVDFAVLERLVKHPQFFVPYLGTLRALVITLALVGALLLALTFETPTSGALGELHWRLIIAFGMFAAGISAFYLLRFPLVTSLQRLEPSFDAVTDSKRFGLFGNILLNAALLVAGTPNRVKPTDYARLLPRSKSAGLPHIVAVQIESFFDVRRMEPSIDAALLKNFNSIRRDAQFSGRLRVPGWGAYTQRTEFGFLTGVQGEALGVDRQDPYLRYARREQWSIAQGLRAMGYKTICIHPFASSFFGRDQVIPRLGFDVFLDERDFPGAARVASYVGDQAIAARILKELEQDDRPKFIFAITVENHGHWRSDRLPESDLEMIRGFVPELPRAFLCYLRHVANADAMIGMLRDGLKGKNAVLCGFGDHLPSFPKLFAERGFDDSRTDYFVWSSRHTRESVEDVAVEDLAARVIDAAGLQLLTAGQAEANSLAVAGLR